MEISIDFDCCDLENIEFHYNNFCVLNLMAIIQKVLNLMAITYKVLNPMALTYKVLIRMAITSKVWVPVINSSYSDSISFEGSNEIAMILCNQNINKSKNLSLVFQTSCFLDSI